MAQGRSTKTSSRCGGLGPVGCQQISLSLNLRARHSDVEEPSFFRNIHLPPFLDERSRVREAPVLQPHLTPNFSVKSPNCLLLLVRSNFIVLSVGRKVAPQKEGEGNASYLINVYMDYFLPANKQWGLGIP